MKTTTHSNTFVLRSKNDYISRARSWQSTTSANAIRNQANIWASKSGWAISDRAWSCYAELRELRIEGAALTKESEYRRYDKIWRKFCKSDRFGLAVFVQQFVLKVDMWC